MITTMKIAVIAMTVRGAGAAPIHTDWGGEGEAERGGVGREKGGCDAEGRGGAEPGRGVVRFIDITPELCLLQKITTR